VPGGSGNTASGNFQFRGGQSSHGQSHGRFVWGDSPNVNYNSTANDQMTFRSGGGVRIFTNTGLTAGVTLAAGGSAWAAVSDRNAKENFSLVNVRDLLKKLCAIRLNVELQVTGQIHSSHRPDGAGFRRRVCSW